MFKKQKTQNTNKGITLIALVITIIVMLILVAVTITMAVNGGLFDYASNAGTKTNTARDAEQEYANLQPGMDYDQLIDKYTTEETSGRVTFTIDGVKFTAKQGTKMRDWLKNQNVDDLMNKGVDFPIRYIIPGAAMIDDASVFKFFVGGVGHAKLFLVGTDDWLPGGHLIVQGGEYETGI